MTTEQEILAETVISAADRHGEPGRISERDSLNDDLWSTMVELGFPLILVPEESGGAGADLADAAAMARAAGKAAIDVPLVETALLGAWLLAAAGLEVPSGPLTVAGQASGIELSGGEGAWRLRGELPRVPWGRFAAAVAVPVSSGGKHYVVSVPAAQLAVLPGSNLAMEPRDGLRIDCELPAAAVALAPEALDYTAVRRRGALARSLQMVGALERVLELTILYARQREQFGRSLARFQVIQQAIAEMAGEVAAATAAVAAAVAASAAGPAGAEVAAAKVRAGAAAGAAARIAHQVHGAIGLTDEHELHHFTGRLWAWREEFGSEHEWGAQLGSQVVARGAESLWADLVSAAA